MAPGWTAQDSNLNGEKRFLSFLNHPDWLGFPRSFLFIGYHCSFLGVKEPGLDVTLSPPSGAEFENGWSYISTPLWCGQGKNYHLINFYLLSYSSTYLLCEVHGIL
jgi:hypothetical protein